MIPRHLSAMAFGRGRSRVSREAKMGLVTIPSFYVPSHQRTAAELDPQEKNAISHRGQALEQLSTVLTEAFLV